MYFKKRFLIFIASAFKGDYNESYLQVQPKSIDNFLFNLRKIHKLV